MRKLKYTDTIIYNGLNIPHWTEYIAINPDGTVVCAARVPMIKHKISNIWQPGKGRGYFKILQDLKVEIPSDWTKTQINILT